MLFIIDVVDVCSILFRFQNRSQRNVHELLTGEMERTKQFVDNKGISWGTLRRTQVFYLNQHFDHSALTIMK